MKRTNPLKRRGWTPTRAGRWIDPETGKSHTTAEAWAVINARTRTGRKA
jgi:hypothetical protein